MIAVLASSFLPAFAVTYRYRADPVLVVKTIAEDDELRQTGIILMADSRAAFDHPSTVLASKLLAQYKILVTFNGIPVTPTSYTCQIIEKDKVNPYKSPQGVWENLITKVVVTDNFICKWRTGKQGVGVLDLYYIGTHTGQFIADYVVVVQATLAIGRTVVYGTEMQDVCVLGWPVVVVGVANGANSQNAAPDYWFTKPDGTRHYIWADPLGNYMSCEDAALVQKAALLIQIPWT
jgi:hypothetical protein